MFIMLQKDVRQNIFCPHTIKKQTLNMLELFCIEIQILDLQTVPGKHFYINNVHCDYSLCCE